LNSRIELGRGILDLIRTHFDRLEQAAAGGSPARPHAAEWVPTVVKVGLGQVQPGERYSRQ
jgi:hypothetical protein